VAGVVAAFACVSAAEAAAPATLTEDPPTAKAAKAGALGGTIGNAGQVATLTAVSRVTGRRYTPKTFDRKSGRFRFEGLPGDATYDVCITTRDPRRVEKIAPRRVEKIAPRRIEGIDLSWVEARMLRLAAKRRKDLGVPAPAEHTFTRADADELVKFVAEREDFSDVNRPLYIRGEAGRAVMLVERIRSRQFHAAKSGEMIWRTDLWYFTYDAGGWQLVGNTERLVERRRLLPDAWRRFTLVYEAALSGYVDENGKSKPIAYTLAEPPDPAKGRIAGRPLKEAAKPVILGLPPTATRPAGRSVLPAKPK